MRDGLHHGDDPSLLLVSVLPLQDGDQAECLQLADQLRSELLDLDVQDVEAARSEPADGAKGGLAAMGGWLVVHLGPEAVKKAVWLIFSWAQRNGRTVEVSLNGDILKVTGVSREQQDRIIDEWCARHDVQK